jgi:hypothetical protein
MPQRAERHKMGRHGGTPGQDLLNQPAAAGASADLANWLITRIF